MKNVKKTLFLPIIETAVSLALLVTYLSSNFYSPAREFSNYLNKNQINNFEMNINNNFYNSDTSYKNGPSVNMNEYLAELNIFKKSFSKNNNVTLFASFKYDDYFNTHYSFNSFENRILINGKSDKDFSEIQKRIKILSGDYPEKIDEAVFSRDDYHKSLLISKKTANKLLDALHPTYESLIGNMLYVTPYNHEVSVIDIDEVVYREYYFGNLANPYDANFQFYSFNNFNCVSSNIISGVYESEYYPDNLSISNYTEGFYETKGFYFQSNGTRKQDEESLSYLFSKYKYEYLGKKIGFYLFDFIFDFKENMKTMRNSLIDKKDKLNIVSTVCLISSLSLFVLSSLSLTAYYIYKHKKD